MASVVRLGSPVLQGPSLFHELVNERGACSSFASFLAPSESLFYVGSDKNNERVATWRSPSSLRVAVVVVQQRGGGAALPLNSSNHSSSAVGGERDGWHVAAESPALPRIRCAARSRVL